MVEKFNATILNILGVGLLFALLLIDRKRMDSIGSTAHNKNLMWMEVIIFQPKPFMIYLCLINVAQLPNRLNHSN